MLRAFPPALGNFYPHCPVYACTGFLCPGCGITRCLAALARGDLHQAMKFNPLVVLLLPLLVVYVVATYRRWAFSAVSKPGWPALSDRSIAGLLILTALFTVARNLPFAEF